MPELPEVNTVQKYFDAEAKGLIIRQVLVQDDHIIRNLSGDAFTQRLTGQKVTGSYRQGKYLFAALDSGHHVLLHLGMTGDLQFYEDPQDRPRFERFHWQFTNGRYMGFDDQRKFARIIYIENLQEYLNEIKLGPDALTITERDFLYKMKGRNIAIKIFLMDQHTLAGIGNLYADEICYQVRVHPASKVAAISKYKQKQLFNKMRGILKYACDQDAYYRVFPDDWFWKWREAGAANPNGRGVVETMKIGGRTTYFVSGWQKMYV